MKIPLHSIVYRGVEWGCRKNFYLDKEYERRFWADIFYSLNIGKRVEITERIGTNILYKLADNARNLGIPFFTFVKFKHTYPIYIADHPNVTLVSENIVDEIKEKNGITVIGDVHGNWHGMKSAVDWAMRRNHFIIFLGDLISHGRDNIKCVEMAYELCTRGDALLILGNHERKAMKHFKEKKKWFGDTSFLDELNSSIISKELRKKIVYRFEVLCQLGRTHLYLDNLIFVHAAWTPEFDEYVECKFLPKRLEYVSTVGFYNEEENKQDFSWIDSIPKGKTVVCGHYSLNKSPVVKDNSAGGKVVIIDSRSSKGGYLTSVDFKYQNGEWKMQNANIW